MDLKELEISSLDHVATNRRLPCTRGTGVSLAGDITAAASTFNYYAGIICRHGKYGLTTGFLLMSDVLISCYPTSTVRGNACRGNDHPLSKFVQLSLVLSQVEPSRVQRSERRGREGEAQTHPPGSRISPVGFPFFGLVFGIEKRSNADWDTLGIRSG